MRSGKESLGRVYAALSARERAVLVLRAWKEGRPEAPEVRRAMPGWQVAEVKRLVDLAHGVNDVLGTLAALLRMQVEAVRRGCVCVCTLHLWGLQAEALRRTCILVAREPITEEEYGRREREAREALLPLAECAEVLAGREGEAGKWREKERELRALVAAGVLLGEGKGSRLRIQAGSFYDWLGEPVPVVPDVGVAYAVVPDARAVEVAWEREQLRRAWEVLARMPEPLDREERGGPAEEGSLRALAWAALAEVRDGLQATWRELRAVEVVVGEVAEELGGEDPALPEVRELLDDAKAVLQGLREDLEPLCGPFDLPEPEETLVALIRRALDLATARA